MELPVKTETPLIESKIETPATEKPAETPVEAPVEAPCPTMSVVKFDQRVQGAVTEVTRIPPPQVFVRTRETLRRSVQELTERSYVYMIKKYENARTIRHSPRADRQAMRAMRDTFNRLMKAVLRNVRQLSPSLEHNMMKKTFTLERPLFEQGFIRFAHHKGVNFERSADARHLCEVYETLNRKDHELNAHYRSLLDEQATLNMTRSKSRQLKAANARIKPDDVAHGMDINKRIDSLRAFAVESVNESLEPFF